MKLKRCFRQVKKFALILLITLYSLSTVGLSFKEFYCCGKLKSISVTLVPETKQHCSKGSEKDGCCDNQYHFFKVNDNHLVGHDVSVPVKHFTELSIYLPSFQQELISSQQLNIGNSTNAPPILHNTPRYITNCVFRIWFLPIFSAISFCYTITFLNSLTQFSLFISFNL